MSFTFHEINVNIALVHEFGLKSAGAVHHLFACFCMVPWLTTNYVRIMHVGWMRVILKVQGLGYHAHEGWIVATIPAQDCNT